MTCEWMSEWMDDAERCQAPHSRTRRWPERSFRTAVVLRHSRRRRRQASKRARDRVHDRARGVAGRRALLSERQGLASWRSARLIITSGTTFTNCASSGASNRAGLTIVRSSARSGPRINDAFDGTVMTQEDFDECSCTKCFTNGTLALDDQQQQQQLRRNPAQHPTRR